MTEAEWLACSDPVAMLRVVAGTRAFRLFSVAGCRHIWHLLTDERGRVRDSVARNKEGGPCFLRTRPAANRNDRVGIFPGSPVTVTLEVSHVRPRCPH